MECSVRQVSRARVNFQEIFPRLRTKRPGISGMQTDLERSASKFNQFMRRSFDVSVRYMSSFAFAFLLSLLRAAKFDEVIVINKILTAGFNACNCSTYRPSQSAYFVITCRPTTSVNEGSFFAVVSSSRCSFLLGQCCLKRDNTDISAT